MCQFHSDRPRELGNLATRKKEKTATKYKPTENYIPFGTA